MMKTSTEEIFEQVGEQVGLPANPRQSGHSTATSLVVLDAAISYVQWLADGVADAAGLLILQPDRNGVEQISKAMRQYGSIEHLYIVAHGSPGCINLGNAKLSLDTIPQYRLLLLTWFMNRLRWVTTSGEDESILERRYTPTCTISFYSCRMAAGEVGTEFIQRLHYLTGAQIAASTQAIGNQVLGGTWHLDQIMCDPMIARADTSQLMMPLPIASQVLAAYPSILGLAG